MYMYPSCVNAFYAKDKINFVSFQNAVFGFVGICGIAFSVLSRFDEGGSLIGGSHLLRTYA